jgi:hypothetical protein
MRMFYDTEYGIYIRENELAAEFQPSDDFPNFNNWVREIAGKNGTLEEVKGKEKGNENSGINLLS